MCHRWISLTYVQHGTDYGLRGLCAESSTRGLRETIHVDAASLAPLTQLVKASAGSNSHHERLGQIPVVQGHMRLYAGRQQRI